MSQDFPEKPAEDQPRQEKVQEVAKVATEIARRKIVIKKRTPITTPPPVTSISQPPEMITSDFLERLISEFPETTTSPAPEEAEKLAKRKRLSSLGVPMKGSEVFEEEQDKREREGRESNEKRARAEHSLRDRFWDNWQRGSIAFGPAAFDHAPGAERADQVTIDLIRASGVPFTESGITRLLGCLTLGDFRLSEQRGEVSFRYRLDEREGTFYDISGYMQAGSTFRVVHIGPGRG